MSEPIDIGIIGTGGLGTGLGRGFESTEGSDVVAIADISDENRANAGDELDVPADARYEDWEAMIEAEDLDAAVVTTPHTLHYEQVVAAMEAGLHVLCEKPLCTDLDHARDLVARSDESDQVLMVGYQRHLSPTYIEAAEQLADNEGDPAFITAEITQDWLNSQLGHWRTDPDLSGGGQLYDTGSHLIDAVLWTTGLTPTSVSAEMLFWDDEERVDIQAVLNVTFEEESVASINVSGDAPQVREHIHFWGDDGAVYVDGKGWNPREVTVIDADGEEYTPEGEHERVSKAEAFVESIRTGAEPPATARDAFYVTAVTEAAYESARTGERVEVSL